MTAIRSASLASIVVISGYIKEGRHPISNREFALNDVIKDATISHCGPSV